MSVNEAQVNEVLPGLIPAIREQVLADAKARIEGLLENGHNTGSQDWYFNEGLREALAALTQKGDKE